MPPQKREFQGRFRFRLYDRENKCSIDLTTDEVQVAFLRIERFKHDERQELSDNQLPNVQRCDGYTPDDGRCRFCVRGMPGRNTGD